MEHANICYDINIYIRIDFEDETLMSTTACQSFEACHTLPDQAFFDSMYNTTRNYYENELHLAVKKIEFIDKDEYDEINKHYKHCEAVMCTANDDGCVVEKVRS